MHDRKCIPFIQIWQIFQLLTLNIVLQLTQARRKPILSMQSSCLLLGDSDLFVCPKNKNHHSSFKTVNKTLTWVWSESRAAGFRRNGRTPQWPLRLQDWRLFEEAGWMRRLSLCRFYLPPNSKTATRSTWGWGFRPTPSQRREAWLTLGAAASNPRCRRTPPGFPAATRYLKNRKRKVRIINNWLPWSCKSIKSHVIWH